MILPTLSEPAFALVVEPARRQPALWRLLLGLVVIAVCYIFATIVVMVVLGIYARLYDPALARGFDAMMGGTFSAPLLIAFLYAFAAVILAAWFAAGALHDRGFASLLGPGGFRRRHYLAGIGIVAVLSLGGFALSLITDPPNPNLSFPQWWPLALVALPALALQTAAEEIAFRGYLMQQLAARFSSPLIWWVGPAVLFGSLHYSSVNFGPNAWLVALAAGFMGLILGDVAVRTGNLSLSMGLHFANNVWALLFVALPGDMDPLSLMTAPIDPDDPAEMRAALLLSLAVLVAIYGLYLVVLARRRR